MTTRRLAIPYLCGVVSPVSGPKYLSVREHLRRRVTALPEQTLLPPEPVLCAEYGVSRITLRRAVDGLVADGHLVREQGRGTYVTRPAIRHEYRESFVHRIAGFSSVMSEHGGAGGHQGADPARRARPRPRWPSSWRWTARADVVELERLRSVDGEPNHVAHSFLPAALTRAPFEQDFSQGSLYDYLRNEYGADLAHARIVVDVGTAAPDEAELLRVVAGSPLLVVRTTVRDTAGSPLVHSYSRLRPDVSQVEFEVSVGGR